MSFLTLVRHGQASFFADDYDRLSPLGETQAALLGDHWAVLRGLKFDEVYTGPRARQRRTAEIVGERYREAGLHWPQPVTLPELDEYDLNGLVGKLIPDLMGRDPAFSDLVQSYQGSKGETGRTRSFQRMFEVLLRHWQQVPEDVEGLEGWQAFRERVRSGLDKIRSGKGNGRQVVAFTSGGFIGTAVHLALDAPAVAALEMNWRIRNCSLTDFIFSSERLTLDSFNAVPHLEDAAVWTYR
jgi:broad specificity phosphatase PhoE